MIELKLCMTKLTGDVLLEAAKKYRKLQIKNLNILKSFLPNNFYFIKHDHSFNQRLKDLSKLVGDVDYYEVETVKKIEYILKKDIKKKRDNVITIRRVFDISDIKLLLKVLKINISLYRGNWEVLSMVYKNKDEINLEHELDLLKSICFYTNGGNKSKKEVFNVSHEVLILQDLYEELSHKLWEITPNHDLYISAAFKSEPKTNEGRKIKCNMIIYPEKQYIKMYKNELSKEVSKFYDKLAKLSLDDFLKDIVDLEEPILKAILMNDMGNLSLAKKKKAEQVYFKHCNISGDLKGNVARFFYQFSKLSYYAKIFIILDIKHFIKEVVLNEV